MIFRKKKIPQMTELELISYVNQLKRQLEGGDKTIEDDLGFASKRAEIQGKVGLIQELTIARQALKTIKSRGLTAEETEKVMQTLAVKCEGCGGWVKKTMKVVVNGLNYCRDCAKKVL